MDSQKRTAKHDAISHLDTGAALEWALGIHIVVEHCSRILRTDPRGEFSRNKDQIYLKWVRQEEIEVVVSAPAITGHFRIRQGLRLAASSNSSGAAKPYLDCNIGEDAERELPFQF